MFSGICKSFAHMVVVLALVVPATAWAGDFDAMIRDMPEIKALGDSDMLDWQTTNDAAAGLSYTVRLPKDWAQDEELRIGKEMLSELLMMEVAQFKSPPRLDGQSVLSIQAMKLRSGYSLAKWFADYRRDQGFTLVGLQAPSDERIAFFAVGQSGGKSTIYRAQAMRVEGMLVMAQYAMPQAVWGLEQGLQKAVIDGLVITPRKAPRAINNADFMHNFKGLISFLVPQNYVTLNRDIDGVDADHVTLRRYSDAAAKRITGRDEDAEAGAGGYANEITVFYVDGADEKLLSRAVSQTQTRLKESGYRIDSDPFEYIDNLMLGVGVRRGVVEVYKMTGRTSKNPPQEHWLGIVQGRDGYALVSTIAPQRQSDHFEWGKISRNLRKVAESVTFLSAN